MSADVENGEDDTARFSTKAIRRRLPSGLTDLQERALIAAVRNPDASWSELATAVGADHVSPVQNAAESLALDLIGPGRDHSEWHEARDGGPREAETFHELTSKQQAVVEFLARHPSFDWRERSSRELRDAVRASGVDAPDMHYTTPKRVAAQYTGLVERRREQLAAAGELDDEDVDVGDAAFDYETPRDLLEQAGVTNLPEENLDSLEHASALSDDDRLELAFERASERQDADDEDGLDHRVAWGDVVDVLDDEEFGDDDVEVGTPYLAEANGVVDWGVWFTLAGDPDSPDDVSGVVPVERLPEGLGPSWWTVGDYAVVVPTGRSPDRGDGKVRHRLALAERPDGTEWDSLRVNAALAEDNEDAESGDESASGRAPAEDTRDEGERSRAFESAAFEALREDLDEVSERVEAVGREAARAAEQAAENAEALPTGEQARALNEAAEAVLEADGEFEALADRIGEAEDDLRALNEWAADVVAEDATLDDVLNDPPGTIAGVVEDLESLRSEVETHGDVLRSRGAASDYAGQLGRVREDLDKYDRREYNVVAAEREVSKSKEPVPGTGSDKHGERVEYRLVLHKPRSDMGDNDNE